MIHDNMKQNVPSITRSQYAIQAIDALFNQPIFQSTDFMARSKIPKDKRLADYQCFEKT